MRLLPFAPLLSFALGMCAYLWSPSLDTVGGLAVLAGLLGFDTYRRSIDATAKLEARVVELEAAKATAGERLTRLENKVR